MTDGLQERLRLHARSLDGLMSLIPAKLYYGEDVSDQWKRKKQTPEQKKAAKIAKLDPDNWRSAKDEHEARAAAAKRKREGDEAESGFGVEMEKPKAVQDAEHPKSKRQRVAQPVSGERPTKQAGKKASKKERKNAKEDKKQVPGSEGKAELAVAPAIRGDIENHMRGLNDLAEARNTCRSPIDKVSRHDNQDTETSSNSSTDVSGIMSPPAQSNSSSISSATADGVERTSKSKPSDTDVRPNHRPQLPALVLPKTQSSTEPTSIPPSSVPTPPKNQAPSTLTASERQQAKDRLAAQLSSLRAARKADVSPRSRQQLLDQRRRKEETRRQAKKEQRRKEKEEETRRQDEEIEKRFSPGGSGSLLGSPRSPPSKDDIGGGNTFSFGRIEFGDGASWDPNSESGVGDKQKKKGPQDALSAYTAAKSKQDRLAGLDKQKRNEIEQKDLWLRAKKRAHGERVKDDTNLLKKALKRTQSQKKRSEKDWSERIEGVQKAQEMKQKKRNENLAKRKEEKGVNGKKAKAGLGSKRRPGFEGSFRGRTGGKKKK